jgi:hypothetical protein
MNIPYPESAIVLLNKMIMTMRGVISYNETLSSDFNESMATLNMQSYVDAGTYSTNPGQHFCGTAACILGYQAIYESATGTTVIELANIAGDIGDDLDTLLGYDISNSVISVTSDHRLSCAKDGNVQNLKHNHLQNCDTTPQDAIDYMEYVITLCEEQL